MTKVVYLGYFNTSQDKCNASPAGVTMMDYVSRVVQRCTGECCILSPVQYPKKLPSKIEILPDGRKVLFVKSYKNAKKYAFWHRYLLRLKRKKNLYTELLRLVEDGDTLLVYHSLSYIDVLKKLRSVRKFKLILQVCEIYADVLEDKKKKKIEIEWLYEADAYLFSTYQLQHIINRDRKKFAVCLGTYSIEPNLNVSFINSEKIHVVYAGTFDIRKGGAAAAAAAEFLPACYHVHIIGFGSSKEIEYIKKIVHDIQRKATATITYDGLFIGHEYIEFLQKCQIGLSTQNPNVDFNATSFPSKILSYMSNGLAVVSIKINAIVKSKVGPYITYYDEQIPEKIAQAILQVDLTVDSRSIISQLDKEFVYDMNNILY